MNSLVGKSTGIALLMAAALLAALFAMGVFSATGVGAQGMPPTIIGLNFDSDDDNTNDQFRFYLARGSVGTDADSVAGTADDPDVIATIEATPGGDSPEVQYELGTLTGFEIGAETGVITYIASGFTAADLDGEITVTSGTWAGDPGSREFTAAPITGDETNSLAATVAVIPSDMASTSRVPGSSQRLTITAAVAGGTGDKITVELPSFGVPSSIDPEDVTIADENPSDVDISGTTVTLFIGRTAADSSTITLSSDVEVVFRKESGITLPIRHGTYPIGIYSDDTTATSVNDERQNRVMVERTVTVKPAKAVRGTDITVSGKGFADGENSATVYVTKEDEDGNKVNVNVGTADIDDGSFNLMVNNDIKRNDVNVFDTGSNSINAEDGTGATDASATDHTINATFAFSTDEATPGQKITITLKDVVGDPSNVKYRSDDLDATDIADNKKSFKITIPSTASLGSSQISFTVDGKNLKKNITIIAKDLELDPSTAVPGQEITIKGTGFTKDERFYDDADSEDTTPDGSVTVGSIDALEATGLEPEAVSNGSITITLRVPATVKPGDRTVRIQGHGGRVGTATLTVPKPTVTLDPDESLRGSTVTVTGTGFPANDFIQIRYADYRRNPAEATYAPAGNGESDGEGNFQTTFRVPSYARIGEEQKVLFLTQLNSLYEDEDDAIESKHSTPDPEVSLSATSAEAGGTITVSGMNYAGFSAVTLVSIGGVDVTPVPSASTDGKGAFNASGIRIPQLDPGQYTVKVQVGGDDGDEDTVLMQIVEATEVVPTATDEVFADLLESGRLSRVWYLDRAEQEWIFYDPREQFVERGLNELTELPARPTVVTLIITPGPNLEFEGEVLYPGTNPIPLN